MNKYWEILSTKVSAMSKRECILIFASLTVFLLSMADTFMLEPVFMSQKALRVQLVQQTASLAEIQAKVITVLEENSPNSNSPLRIQLNRVKKELDEGKDFLQSNREHLVQPEKMAAHLKQLLNRNGRLQLVSLQTMAVTPLMEEPETSTMEAVDNSAPRQPVSVSSKKVFKHGVRLTLRGNYLDLLNYLTELERLPQLMYWAKADMQVVKYPVTELTLVLYTLSLDKTWLQI